MQATNARKFIVAVGMVAKHSRHYQQKFGWSEELEQFCFSWMVSHGLLALISLETVGMKIKDPARCFRYWALRSYESFISMRGEVA